MKRLATIFLVAGTVVATSVLGVATATAAPSATCSGSWQTGPGLLVSGNYQNVTVSGVCLVPDGATITIRGGMTLEPGAQLVAFFTSQVMSIDGNVTVGEGAVLALGCTPEFGCDGVQKPPSQDTVHGNIVARDALSIYLNGDTIHGNVSFVGGGWGPDCTDPNAEDPNDPLGHSLAVKDNDIHGTVTLSGWSGCWIGFIRNTVHGVVNITNNYANQDPANEQGADSTEVVANTIWGVLNCSGNTPAAQYGDALVGAPPGYGPNEVHGVVTGECQSLT